MTRVLTQTFSPDSNYAELDRDAQKVIDWRLEWLLRDGGYRRKNAERIAMDTSIDYRFAIDLHKKCSDERLCMRVLFGR